MQKDLRAAIAERNAAETKLAELNARLTAAESERDSAEQAALQATAAYAAALGADDQSAVMGPKAARAQATAAYDDLVLKAQAIADRIAAVDREVTAHRRGAAHARERVAVAIAGQRETALRAAASVFAKAKREWHVAAATAAEARYASTGLVGGEPVSHTGWQASMLGGDLLDIFARAGLAENLTPVHIGGMSEADLLKETAS